MTVTPKISVILTSYNHAQYLREAIESVLNQTYKDFELIIWDDASTDDSWNIISGYSDSRIRAFRNDTNQSGQYFRNTISEAKGEYIAIHHSDDVWEANKLEKQMVFLTENPEIGAVFSNALIIGEDGELFEDQAHFYYKIFDQPNRTRYEWLNYFFYHGNALCHPSVLIRKVCYDECGLYRYGLSQIPDFDMWIRLCLKYGIHVLPEKLVRFRVRKNEANTSGNRSEVHIRGQFEYLQIYSNYLLITNQDEFTSIFPNSVIYFEKEDFYIPFALAMMALSSSYSFGKLFGLQLLFNMINDPECAKKIEQVYGFNYLDFIALSGKHDIFSVIALHEIKQQVQSLTSEVHVLASQVVEKEEAIQGLASQVADREKSVQALNAKLWEIYGTRAWHLIQVLWRIKLILVPHGSRRERLIYMGIGIYHILRYEGVLALLKRGYRKLFPQKAIDAQFLLEPENIKPIVSIVMPVYNAAAFTKNCIEQIYKSHNELLFEVIVIDNHSSDETEKLLKTEQKIRPDFRFYRMQSNLGFAGAVNYGFRQAKGNYIVILNNDTLVTPGWIDRLTEPFTSDEMIGIVSPVTNYVGEGPQIDPNATQILPSDIETYADKIKNRDYIYESNRLVFFCVAIKKEVLDIVGDLDIGYEKGNYEDDDYCMRTIIAGFQLAIARSAFVYHFGTITFKKNRISHNEFMERNRKRFYQKAQNISVTLRSSRRRTMEATTSVIVRTLNRPELLRNALTSLSNQTSGDFEVVVVNDGGKDISNLLGVFEKHFPITYAHNTISKGRTAALNIGIDHSRGDWVAFLDDDDIFYPWHLDALISCAKRNSDAHFFYSDYNRCLFDSRQDKYPRKTVGTEPWEYDKQKLLIRNRIPIHTWLISRECFEVAGKFNEDQIMLEDYEFLVRLSTIFDFQHVKQFTCEYRYYLDGVNSMATQRTKTLDALKFIYNQNPVDDVRVANERKYELASLEHQIKKIDELHNMLEANPEQEKKIYREIIKLVAGL